MATLPPAWLLVPPSDPALHSTVGAGDTFNAGMLYSMTCRSSDWDLQTKLSFAVELATRKVQLDGFDGVADMTPFPLLDSS